VVEDQSRSSTRVLVDSATDHRELEEMLEASKPVAPREPSGLSYLLWTPFRYPPLKHGSRFGTKLEGGLWYGSDRLETALAETAYYKLLFLEGPAKELGAIKPRLSAFQALVGTARGADLSRAPFDRFRLQISAKDVYAASQRLGAEMRADGVEACRYFSARARDEGTNLVVFTPAAFTKKTPGPPQTWACYATRESVEFRRSEVRGPRLHVFSRTDFLVQGKVPAPAP
jgi:RES domain